MRARCTRSPEVALSSNCSTFHSVRVSSRRVAYLCSPRPAQGFGRLIYASVSMLAMPPLHTCNSFATTYRSGGSVCCSASSHDCWAIRARVHTHSRTPGRLLLSVLTSDVLTLDHAEASVMRTHFRSPANVSSVLTSIVSTSAYRVPGILSEYICVPGISSEYNFPCTKYLK